MTVSTVLINGEPGDGAIPVTDSSVLRGDGCFEVIRAYRGIPFRLDDHLDRLDRSSSALGITLPPRSDLAKWIGESAESLGDCAVRVVVTRGASVPGLADPSRVIVFAHSWDNPGPTTRLLPVVAPWHSAGVDWDLAGAKLISYAPNMAATRRAQQEGFDDALLVSTDGRVLEGPTFSVGWVVDGVLETPGLDNGILDSITRRVVLELADVEGIDLIEGSWDMTRLQDAREVMALSTIREVQAVTAVGALRFEPGPVTTRLRSAFNGQVG